jgi:signal peptidase
MRMLRWALPGLLLALLATGAVLAHSGYRLYIVHTGSMTPTFKPGDAVIDRPSRQIKPGQVITFRHSAAPDVVTHRVTEVTAAGLIHTKGDANPTADVWDIRPDMVRGSVAWQVPRLGYLLVFLKQPAGIGALAGSLLALSLLWSLFFGQQPAARAAARTRQTKQARHRPGRHAASEVYHPLGSLLT